MTADPDVWPLKLSSGAVVQMDRAQLEADAQKLAAYAVNLARGYDFEPWEFGALCEIAGRHGMFTGVPGPMGEVPACVNEWLGVQAIRTQDRNKAMLWSARTDEYERRARLIPSWWKRLFG